MPALNISTVEAAEALVDVLSGRLEVMADDGDEDSADYEDTETVLDQVNQAGEYPCVITLNFAEGEQAKIAIETLLEDYPEHRGELSVLDDNGQPL